MSSHDSEVKRVYDVYQYIFSGRRVCVRHASYILSTHSDNGLHFDTYSVWAFKFAFYQTHTRRSDGAPETDGALKSVVRDKIRHISNLYVTTSSW